MIATRWAIKREEYVKHACGFEHRVTYYWNGRGFYIHIKEIKLWKTEDAAYRNCYKLRQCFKSSADTREDILEHTAEYSVVEISLDFKNELALHEVRTNRAEFLAYKHTCSQCPDLEASDCVDYCESRYLKKKGPYFDYAKAFKLSYHQLDDASRRIIDSKFNIKLHKNMYDIVYKGARL